MQRIQILSFILLFFGSFLLAQNTDKLTKPILEEAMLMYRSEMASWYGTDLVMAQYPDKTKIGGYFSYSDKDKNICVFYSKDEIPVVLATISFDDTFNIETAEADFDERNFTKDELMLYRLRIKASEIIQNDNFGFFKHYDKTNYNLIPLIGKKENKVYILTGPTENGVMVLGNDYLLTFDKEEELTSKKSLHKNILFFEFSKDNDQVASMHTHLEETGELITATDICTLMLYGKFTNWKTHYVFSDKYVSIWSIENEKLFVMTREAWEKIPKDSE